MRVLRTIVLGAWMLAGLIPTNVHAQNLAFSAGPQLTTMGVGISGSARLSPLISGSAEFNFLPFPEVTFDEDDITYTADPEIWGGLFTINLHPLRNHFSLGAGLFFGGYRFDASATPSESVEIGDEIYSPSQIGTLDGDFSLGGPTPVVLVGWRGAGLNFSVGIAGARSKVDLAASGPLAEDPDFREELDKEMEDIREAVKVTPVIPYLRIGYQFGL